MIDFKKHGIDLNQVQNELQRVLGPSRIDFDSLAANSKKPLSKKQTHRFQLTLQEMQEIEHALNLTKLNEVLRTKFSDSIHNVRKRVMNKAYKEVK